MGNGTSWALFALFCVVLVIMYLGVRRRWLSPMILGGGGIILSILLMTLSGLAQGNTIYQAVFVGLIVGGLFSIGALVMATYFSRSERRAQVTPDTSEQPSL